MRRLKTYFRSRMTAPRLYACAVGHIHRDITASLSPLDIFREFSSRNQSRKEHFGKVWSKAKLDLVTCKIQDNNFSIWSREFIKISQISVSLNLKRSVHYALSHQTLYLNFATLVLTLRRAVSVYARVSRFGTNLHVCQPSNFRRLIYPPCIFGCFCQIVWPMAYFIPRCQPMEAVCG